MSDLSEHDRSILRLFIDAPEKLFDDTGSERVKISGAKNIFVQPEFQRRDLASDEEFQGIIELIDNEEVVIHVLERSSGEMAVDCERRISPFALAVNSKSET